MDAPTASSRAHISSSKLGTEENERYETRGSKPRVDSVRLTASCPATNLAFGVCKETLSRFTEGSGLERFFWRLVSLPLDKSYIGLESKHGASPGTIKVARDLLKDTPLITKRRWMWLRCSRSAGPWTSLPRPSDQLSGCWSLADRVPEKDEYTANPETREPLPPSPQPSPVGSEKFPPRVSPRIILRRRCLLSMTDSRASGCTDDKGLDRVAKGSRK
jgi:hypothetical protein